MTNKEVIDAGNILIAAFEGRKFNGRYTIDKFGGDTCNSLPEMKYHTSWDWLMPVVVKVNKICSDNGRPLSNRSREQEHLENPLDNPLHWKSWSYHSVSLSTDINKVWKNVMDFIHWYNKQK